MAEMKQIELRVKLNDFTSPVVAVFQVPVSTPVDDEMVGHALVQLSELVLDSIAYEED